MTKLQDFLQVETISSEALNALRNFFFTEISDVIGSFNQTLEI